MYAIEFEADIQDGTIKIPQMYRQLENSHAKIVLMVEDSRIPAPNVEEFDFSSMHIQAFSGQDVLAIQKAMRDEW